MVEIKSEKGELFVNVSGSHVDVSAELALAIGDIFLKIAETDEDAARRFRFMMQCAMDDRAPTWEDYGEEETP